MSFTGVDSLDKSIHKTNLWVADVAEEFGTKDRQFAYRALRAWLHTVRERLTTDVAAHLSAQLPELLRGVFYEGWHPSRMPARYDRQGFLDHFIRDARIANDDAPHAVAVVTRVVRRHLGNGAIELALEQLPRDIRSLLEPAAEQARSQDRA